MAKNLQKHQGNRARPARAGKPRGTASTGRGAAPAPDQVTENQAAIAKQLAERQARNNAVIALLDQWSQGDPREQQETWAFLAKAIDEDRLSDRKFFAGK